MSTFLTPEQDQQLVANGYEPIPVIGKAAIAEGWQTGVISNERIALLRKAYPNAKNTGLRCGVLGAVDVDIVPADHSDAVQRLAFTHFQETPLIRFGSKGAMLCYRNETPLRKITVLTNTEAKVEILGQGLQFVAFGIHPQTNQPFQWRGRTEFDEEANPLNTPIDTLPSVTPAQIRQFAEACAALLRTLGYSDCRVREAYQEEKQTRETNVEEDSEKNKALALRHLLNCVEQGKVAVLGQLGNDTIYELACLLRDRYYLSAPIIEDLMLKHWYPHCVPNTWVDECKQIISHAASYMQNEPGARAIPPAAEAFREALDKLPDEPMPGGSDTGGPKQIKLEDEDYDTDDTPTIAAVYIGQQFPPLLELIPTWCERNINTFLEGPAATQKSRAALQDAIALSVGLPVLGKSNVEQTDCLYLNYENSPEEMARRTHMICEYLRGDNKTPAIDPKGVHIWELRKHPRPLLTVSREKGLLVTRFGQRVLSWIATRRNAGKHTLVIFDGLMDAIIFHDNTRNDDTVAMSLIRLIDSWCVEYDFTAYSIVHPSRSSERGGSVGSYATAWTTKPRAIQTFKRVLSPYAGGGSKAKITEDTPLGDIFYQRRVQKRSNGPEGDRMLLEYHKGGLRPHLPPKKTRAPAALPAPSQEEELEDTEF